jgi:HPt (histidine-containing phosphotransfer) domain-containing protein
MHQKPDITPRTPSGVPGEIVPVPSIAETKGLVADGAHMRMDPRVLSRINDVVSILEQDYSNVLREQLAEIVGLYSTWQKDATASRDAIREIAHDIRGVAATFGRPLAGQIATRLCGVLNQSPDNASAIEEHLDALDHVANLTPEPDGVSAKLALKRLDELVIETPEQHLISPTNEEEGVTQ